MVFAALWLLYFCIYIIGETFLHFQWDILLLEAGGIAVIVAAAGGDGREGGPALFLCNWLLFRLMLQSGVVKLTSGCPAWWGLTALDVCIPSFLHWLTFLVILLGPVVYDPMVR